MYEFLYRAISDYVDLYKNKDEDYEYSVPVGAVAQNGTTKVWLDKIFLVNFNWKYFSLQSQWCQQNPWNPMDRDPTVFQWDLEPEHQSPQAPMEVLADIKRGGATL